MCDRLAGCQIADHCCDEGDGEEDVKVTKKTLMGAFPSGAGEGAEEHADTVFDCP